jgi:hypothetical protein
MKNLITIAAIGLAMSLVNQPAIASEYGCTVLLCLSNPASNGGPRGIAQCVDPINKLYRDLRKGRPFPTCDFADGNDGTSYAQLVSDPYDICPQPLTPVAAGARVAEGQFKRVSKFDYLISGSDRISEGSNPDPLSYLAGPRACVGKRLGQSQSDDYSYTFDVYDKVVWLPAQTSRAIDIYIDNTLNKRVRF